MGGLDGGSMFGFGLIGLILIIVVVVLVAKSWSGGPAGRSGEDRALAILKERYARGEIDKTEFDARKHDLT